METLRLSRSAALAAYRQAVTGHAKAAENIAIVQRFIDARTPWTREAVTGYLRKLEAGGKVPSTVDHERSVLHGFGTKTGLGWPGCDWRWDRVAAPSRQVRASPELVARLAAALPQAGRRAGAWFLLSVVYGCRAGELALWSTHDLGRGDAVYIRREKDGDSRWHYLPPILRPRLAGVLLRPMRKPEVYSAWRAIHSAAGVPTEDGVSWHSLRYALVNGLADAGLTDAEIHHFLAWSRGEADEEIVRHYRGANAEVGADGKVRKVEASKRVPPEPDARRLLADDTRAWSLHPFRTLFG